MRKLHIIFPLFEQMNQIVIYDGPTPKEILSRMKPEEHNTNLNNLEKHRKSFDNLELFLNSLPNCLEGYDPKKHISVYLEGVSEDRLGEIKSRLSEKLPRAEYC